MLPKDRDARANYLSVRDYRSRWRKWDLENHGPEMVKSEAIKMLDSSADIETFREQVDFMRSEGFLTAPMEEAAENVIAWAEALQTILSQVPR